MGRSIKLYSLFYVDVMHAEHKNLRSRLNSLDIYLRCGSLLAKSARHFDIDFSIVTNNIDLVRSRLEELGASHVHTISHQFHRDVPKDVDFYAAHFKLDLIQAFGTGAFGDRIGLIDIDTVFLRPLPAWVHDAECLLAYAIGGQVFPQYGRDRILQDLQSVAGRSQNIPVWYGGEFLMGTSNIFRRVSDYIELCWPAYLSNVKKLHHSGDEMVITAALARAGENGEPIQDVGSAGVVNRWWSVQTGFVQQSLRTASGACLIHLPADKTFLAAQSRLPFYPEKFLESYELHASRKILLRKLYRGAWPTKKRQYLGSIT